MSFNNHLPFIPSILLSFLMMLTVLSYTGNQIPQNANAMLFSDANSFITRTSASITHQETDTSPVTAFIIITDDQGTTVYRPNNITIRVGEEVIILNNSTTPHSVTSGGGPDDPLSGRLFDTGTIEPESFVEYTASNLGPGKYPFFSAENPDIKGTLTIVENN